MTSYLIDDFARRASVQECVSQNLDQSCVFCQIISDRAPCHKIYEDQNTIAVLDIQPIRRGHALVIPKAHIKRLSDLSPELAAALGATVSQIADAICRALDITGLNVVCNQEYAQAVPHVHYHIVPAPSASINDGEVIGSSKAMLPDVIFLRELQVRGDLDDVEGSQLSQQIKSKL